MADSPKDTSPKSEIKPDDLIQITTPEEAALLEKQFETFAEHQRDQERLAKLKTEIPDWVDKSDTIHLSFDENAVAEPSDAAPEDDQDDPPYDSRARQHPITPQTRKKIEDQGLWGEDWPPKTESPYPQGTVTDSATPIAKDTRSIIHQSSAPSNTASVSPSRSPTPKQWEASKERIRADKEWDINHPRHVSHTVAQKAWLVVEVLFAIAAAIGGMTIKSSVLSFLFILAGWLLVTAVIWQVNFLEKSRLAKQRTFNGILTLLVLVVLVGIWWAARPEPGLTRQDIQEVFRNEMALPNVEATLTIDKRLRIENRGDIPLIEVELMQFEYLFQKRAWDEKRLQIELVNRPSAAFGHFKRIDPGKASEEIDLKKVPFFAFRHFMDITDHEEASRRNYLIRITFRDERSKEKYITYRVTTSVTNAPGIFENLSTTARSGPGVRILEDDIPMAIISAQSQIDAGIGAKEISIKYQWQN